MIDKLKKILKANPSMIDTFAFCYSLLYGNSNIFRRKNAYLQKGAFLKGNIFKISGKNNKIILGRKARINNCKFTIIGNNCLITVGEGSTIVSNVHFWCQDDNSTIIIGDDFTMEGGHIAATEGKTITIGADCMFSDNVEIRNGDSHSIIDKAINRRINYARPVFIGNHVWLAANVRVLKGATIPSNSIIGNSSLVTSQLKYQNALYSGIPAKLIKENIDWDRNQL